MSDTSTPGQQPHSQAAQPPAPSVDGPTTSAYPAAPPAGDPTARTNVMAILSMISSILGLTVLPVVGSIVAVVTGHIARRQIAETGEQGSGAATAGLVIGYVGVALLALLIVGAILFVTLVAAA
ncbi:DUF4190 domain-containing protein [Actinotalea sp. K2]|uniref:DUF4190 domain-containing protein n=1 Tax=Actinotalea sp. K2 TaxID=2939438 RepID=UPI002018058A|nr:DUF4190 domain-containing protein [Actinotalea sp. K2]MCL3859672.1 DUF4190 domain-containing protein [Actinotalea sp. K2]